MILGVMPSSATRRASTPSGVPRRSRPGMHRRLLRPAQTRSSSSVVAPRVRHRPAHEGGHGRRAGGRRRAQADELEHRTVADVRRRRFGAVVRVVQRLADGGCRRQVPVVGPGEGDAELGAVAGHCRDDRRMRDVHRPSGQRPGRRHREVQEEEVVAGEEAGEIDPARVLERRQMGQQVTQQQVGAALQPDVHVVPHVQALRGDAHHVDRSVGSDGVVEERSGHGREEPQPVDCGGRVAAEPCGVARPLVHRRERTVTPGRVLDDPDRLRRPDGGDHGHAGVVPVRRLEPHPAARQLPVGAGDVVGPALGDHRRAHRAAQGIDGVRIVDGRPAVEERRAPEGRHDVCGGSKAGGLGRAAVEAP